MRLAAHPHWYDPTVSPPTLTGSSCAGCGQVDFPPIALGCQVCGAPEDQLEPITLAAAGLVHAVARVEAVRAGTEPYTVAEILLDGGPLIRALIHPESATPGIGERAVARWRVIGRDESGADLVEPWFVTGEQANGGDR